jgi:hypothetical protein
MYPAFVQSRVLLRFVADPTKSASSGDAADLIESLPLVTSVKNDDEGADMLVHLSLY